MKYAILAYIFMFINATSSLFAQDRNLSSDQNKSNFIPGFYIQCPNQSFDNACKKLVQEHVESFGTEGEPYAQVYFMLFKNHKSYIVEARLPFDLTLTDLIWEEIKKDRIQAILKNEKKSTFNLKVNARCLTNTDTGAIYALVVDEANYPYAEEDQTSPSSGQDSTTGKGSSNEALLRELDSAAEGAKSLLESLQTY
jgi:hypothetical protein